MEREGACCRRTGAGRWYPTVNVSGKDAAGNTVSGSQTIGVDTASPVISVDTIARGQHHQRG